MERAAKIENGIVTEVINGNHQWAIDNLGGNWVDTKGLKVGIGWEYVNEGFIAPNPQPYPSWTLDESGRWIPPTPYPEDSESILDWDEETLSWK